MFVDWLTSIQTKVLDTNSIRHYLLLGFSKAHASIVEGAENDVWNCGTTTLLGGMLVEVDLSLFCVLIATRVLKILRTTRCSLFALLSEIVKLSIGTNNQVLLPMSLMETERTPSTPEIVVVDLALTWMEDNPI